MVENISATLEAGEPPMEAALKGAEQIWVHHHVADRVADLGA